MRLVSIGGVIRRVLREGVNIGSRPAINLHEGSGIQIVTTDDTVNDEIDVTIASTVSGGVTAHGALTGLGADDHTQYALDTDLTTHAGAADPHTTYLKEKASGGLAAEVPTHTHADAANAGTITEAAVTNLVSDLAGKSATGHGHVESDVASLVGDLAAKAASVHTHTESDVSSLVADLTVAHQRTLMLMGA